MWTRTRQHVTMLRFNLVSLVALLAVVLAEDIVVLKQGSLRGHRLTTRKGRGIFAFQGVPFAKPPVEELRFQPPQLPEPWEGVLDATKEGANCIQRGMLPAERSLVKGEEDCLFLNVYTPQIPVGGVTEELDVMVWIHGGGYSFGSGDTDFYGPQYLLDKDIILVTINYRLGIFGFLSTGDATCPGNNGLKDQAAALRWVQDNIAAFGGNPNSVTIFGESAGGGSVHLHVLSPYSKGLFHRAIAQSGNALCPWAFERNGKHISEKVAGVFDCPTQQTEELISCLRRQNAYDLLDADYESTDGSNLIIYRPVMESEVGKGDAAFLAENPMKIILNDDQEYVPMMLGFTSNEGGLFATMLLAPEEDEMKLNDDILKSLLSESDSEETPEDILEKIKEFYFENKPMTKESIPNLMKLGGDFLFFAGTNTAVRLHSERGATVYYYLFDYRGTNSFSSIFSNSTEDVGAVHLDDVYYLFPQDFSFPDTKHTPEDESMIDLMTTIWVNFARKGNPTSNWHPVSSHDAPEYAHIVSGGLHEHKGLFKERVDFWDSLSIQSSYPKVSHKDEL